MAPTQQVELLDKEDIRRLGQQLGFCRSLLEEAVPGDAFDHSLGDLGRLQAILDSGQLQPTDTAELQALGVPFGQMLVHLHPEFNWWMVIDEVGRDACIRYRESDLLLYPLTLISKRAETGQRVDVTALYGQLMTQLEPIIAQLDAAQSAEHRGT